MREALAIILLNTDAYPNLDFSTIEQNDKHMIAVLKAIFHSCLASSVIPLNWRQMPVGSAVLHTTSQGTDLYKSIEWYMTLLGGKSISLVILYSTWVNLI